MLSRFYSHKNRPITVEWRRIVNNTIGSILMTYILESVLNLLLIRYDLRAAPHTLCVTIILRRT